MVFLYNSQAGKELLKLKGETFKYLVKVRRHQVGDTLHLRQKENPSMLHSYTVSDIDARTLTLELLSSKKTEQKPEHPLHIGWCVIDPKSVEKVLATLNEIGVERISFIYCKRSQKNFKPDIKRYERILEASNQQCGRSNFMQFHIYKDLESFIQAYPEVKVFDFCDTILGKDAQFQTVLIGCEGGFAPQERLLLTKQESFRLNTPMVLRSESAAVAVAAKLIL